MQTIIIDLDRVQDIKYDPVTKQITGCVPDTGGKISPAFVVIVKGEHHSQKNHRVAITQNGFLKHDRV